MLHRMELISLKLGIWMEEELSVQKLVCSDVTFINYESVQRCRILQFSLTYKLKKKFKIINEWINDKLPKQRVFLKGLLYFDSW